MIGRLRGRGDFEALRRRGRTVKEGPIQLRWYRHDDHSHDSHPEAHFGYAIPRRVGSAVVRNRHRRRLAGVLTELDHEGAVPPGCYLIRCTGAFERWDHDRLRTTMMELLRATVSPPSSPDAPAAVPTGEPTS